MYEIMNFDYTLLIRLVAALILGGLIGLERGGSNHEAGLRTHIVLCLGAALVMVISESLVKQYGGDIMRLGAQVISGVGFLGVGSIIIDGNKVRGITTAAGLWTTACIGLAVGSGYYIIASAVVALMLFAMLGLRSFTKKLYSRSLKYSIRIDLNDRTAIKEIFKKLMDECAQICSARVEEEDDEIYMILEIKPQKSSSLSELMSELTAYGRVKEFRTM